MLIHRATQERGCPDGLPTYSSRSDGADHGQFIPATKRPPSRQVRAFSLLRAPVCEFRAKGTGGLCGFREGLSVDDQFGDVNLRGFKSLVVPEIRETGPEQNFRSLCARGDRAIAVCTQYAENQENGYALHRSIGYPPAAVAWSFVSSYRWLRRHRIEPERVAARGVEAARDPDVIAHARPAGVPIQWVGAHQVLSPGRH
jgi:hypothetical protein